MPEQPKMTPQKAHSYLRVTCATVVVFLLFLVSLLIYGLVHPARHVVLLLLLATFLCPVLFTILLRKTRLRGLFDRNSTIDPTSAKAALRRHPVILIVFPVIAIAVVWGLLLVTIGIKEDGDHKAWMKRYSVLTSLWIMMPQVATAYFLVALHATYAGMYVAACIVYLTIGIAVGGLQLENGIAGFYGTYKAQASPLVVLSYALICAASFGILHFAIWSLWPGEYSNMRGIEDAMYFSVVTMATVGYGDILPVGHAARALCLLEIVSGILLLVVGVSASMTIWLQTKQPVSENNTNNSKNPPGQEPNEASEPVGPIDS